MAKVQVEEKLSHIPHVEVQMSTPLKRETKQNHVRFASPTHSVQNGRVSPILDENVVEYLHMPSGFPYIHNKVSGPISDSLVVQTSGSCDVTAASLIEQSQLDATEADYSANNSVCNLENSSSMTGRGGEENEPPGGGGTGDRRGQGQRPQGGQSGRSSQSSGNQPCYATVPFLFGYNAVLQIRRGKRDDLRIFFHITPLKHIL